MSETVFSVLFVVSRYLHIIAMSLMVGGTFFFEMVVPIAISDLKDEQQLVVFGRARWIFKRVVYISAMILILTGSVSLFRNWYAYGGSEAAVLAKISGRPTSQPLVSPMFRNSGAWAAAHAGVSLLSIGLAVGLVGGGTPPTRPIRWMRINLVLLLVAIFLASAARHARLRSVETVLWPFIAPEERVRD